MLPLPSTTFSKASCPTDVLHICACPSVSGQPSVDGAFLRGWHSGEPLLSTSFDTLELLLLLLPVLPPLPSSPWNCLLSPGVFVGFLELHVS